MKYKKSMGSKHSLTKEKKEHTKKSGTVYMEGSFLSSVRGFGFVSVDGMESDLYIPEKKTLGAFYGDIVEVKLLPGYDPGLVHQYESYRKALENGEKPGRVTKTRSGRRTEGEVVKILQHTVSKIVGTFRLEGRHGYVVPDNHHIPFDINVVSGETMDASDGDKVVLAITDYGSAKKNASGKICEILGAAGDPGVDILSIIRANDLPGDFPEDVKKEVAETIPSSINHSDFISAKARRKGSHVEDLRKTVMVTIDGLDTKDIDDAVSLSRTDDGLYRLGVHIADVSFYVKEGSPLDREALNRATSIYLVDRVIPMLPRELSNGICSLNEGEERLALSCIMDIDGEGKVVRHRITESVVKIDARLSYEGTHAWLTKGDNSEIVEHLRGQGIHRGIRAKTKAIEDMLTEMEELSKILTEARNRRGCIDFDTPEAKIILDENGKPVDIRQYEHNESNLLIENFMLYANETVAMHFAKMKVPFVYRVHGKPDPEKIESLRKFLGNLGIRTGSEKSGKKEKEEGDVKPIEIRNLLERIKGTPEEATLTRMTLRSMQQAYYSTDCAGHFGLALKYYCHFTSPIRRYPDLQIHRIIREVIGAEGLSAERKEHYDTILPDVCEQSSKNERRADEAERETDKQKMCEYMTEHIGEVYDGIVSGLTGWGMYVELPNTIEGLVPMAVLFDDYYVFDEKSYILKGEHTGREYRLGDRIRVKAAAADTATRTIDFVPETEGGRPEEGRNIRNNGKKRTAETGRKQ